MPVTSFRLNSTRVSDEERLLTPVDMMKLLQISEATLFRHMETPGKIPPSVRVGHGYRWSPETVREWIKQNEKDAK